MRAKAALSFSKKTRTETKNTIDFVETFLFKT
jgi:hypothetical protein